MSVEALERSCTSPATHESQIPIPLDPLGATPKSRTLALSPYTSHRGE